MVRPENWSCDVGGPGVKCIVTRSFLLIYLYNEKQEQDTCILVWINYISLHMKSHPRQDNV